MKEKRCPMCGNTFPATSEYFYICQGRPSSYCRKCLKDRQAKYEEHKKANRQAMKELREHRANELRRKVRREARAIDDVIKKFNEKNIKEREKYDFMTDRMRTAAIKKEFGAIVRSGHVVDHDRMQELKRNILGARDADPYDIWAWRYRRDIGVLLKECDELRKSRDKLIRQINKIKRGV